MRRSILLCCSLFLTSLPLQATEYAALALHDRVKFAETIVVARVVDPASASVRVERVLKGAAPKVIKLVDYIDFFSVPSQQKPLIANSRELMFLGKKGDAYAPLQDQYGRWVVRGDRLVDSFAPRDLSRTLRSIQRLVSLQAQAARSEPEADAALVTALKSADVELQTWALVEASELVMVPSPALVDIFIASWPKSYSDIATTLSIWRAEQTAPFFANVLGTSRDGDERGWAALALGGAGGRRYLPTLRQIAVEDPHPFARAQAFEGITLVLGHESLSDLRRGANDRDPQVRVIVAGHAYNLLEFGAARPLWPRPSEVLIAEVRAFLAEMLRDPVDSVRQAATSMLAMMTQQHP
ncbi:MAG: HEAT repeat domain-containing protein [Vicinamibacterales bacterium]